MFSFTTVAQMDYFLDYMELNQDNKSKTFSIVCDISKCLINCFIY